MADKGLVLVTGASSGIGLAISQLLLRQGYRVVGISRRGEVSEIDDPGFDGISLDLGDTDRLAAEIGKLCRQSEIEYFVHAGGQGRFGSIEQFSPTQIEDLLRVNLVSAMIISRALLPGMRHRGRGRLIFIGSESALAAGRKGALYCASKFGLRGFALSLREDCAADGLQVSLVNPGMVRSPFFERQSFAPGAKPENAVMPEDVAHIVLQIMQASADIVVDEVNLSPRVKSIDFTRKP